MDRAQELARRRRRHLLASAGVCDVRPEEWTRPRRAIADRCVQPRSCSLSGEGTRADSRATAGNSGEEGILWHKRVSRFKASEHGEYDTWWKAIGQDHIAQEEEYVDNLVKVVDIGKNEGKKGEFVRS